MSQQDKVQVGNLMMREYAAQKPLSINAAGEFVTAADLVANRELGFGSLHALDMDSQVKLTLERNQLEPDYKIGILGVGLLTKAEVMQHVQARTKVGQEIVRAEINYCNDLIETLTGEVVPQTSLLRDPILQPIPPWIRPPYWRILKAIALFCENTTDAVTKLAAAYRKQYVHSVFSARGFEATVLEGSDDVRVKFAPIAKGSRTVYISGVGHGSPTVYTGDRGDHILEVGAYDPAEVKGKCIHLLSCQTAQQLGPDLVQKGARAYVGYFENFTFVGDQAGTPINELELFWQCDSKFDIMMANGATVEEAYNAAIAEYNAAIQLVPNSVTATWLTHDRNYFRIYGDKTATIFPWILVPYIPVIQPQVALAQNMEERMVELVNAY